MMKKLRLFQCFVFSCRPKICKTCFFKPENNGVLRKELQAITNVHFCNRHSFLSTMQNRNFNLIMQVSEQTSHILYSVAATLYVQDQGQSNTPAWSELQFQVGVP